MALVKEYLKLTSQYKKDYGDKTIVLYQVGSFYEVYALKTKTNEYIGSDIEEFSKMNDMLIAEKSKVFINNSQVVMAGFGLAQLDKYVKRMQEYGYTIIVYTQDIQGKNTTRSLSEIISPGTYFSNETIELSNNIMCIWLCKYAENKKMGEKVTIGLSNIDIYTGKSSIFEITKNYIHNPCTYDDLERYISIYNPKESIIISNMTNTITDDIIMYINLSSKKTHKIILNEASENNLNNMCKQAEKQTYQQAIFNH